MRFPDISALYSLFRESPVVTTDSRKASAGIIFFALKGDIFNGNRFAESALKQGCSCVVVDEEEYYRPPSGKAQGLYILVKDCLASLQELAKYHRSQLKIPFIAITGSNGKTTTKEFVKKILSKKYKVLATAGNLNNHIGVPLTILSITSDIEIAIIEIGANHLGEIAMLCEMAQPDYGIITNIGKAHVGEFGSFEAIVKAKTEMYRFLRQKKGKVFINSADALLLENAADIEQITYGTPTATGAEKNFCCCQLAEANPFLKIKYDNEVIASHLIGKYNFENLTASICIGKYFGVETKKIKEAIEEYIPSNNRSQMIQTSKNRLVLDAYNANPSSMSAAIENFYEMEGENKWLILGDMLELGDYELQEHKNILQLLIEKKIQNIILVGSVFSKAMSEIKKNSLSPLLFKNSDELVNRLKSEPLSINPSLILIKGSRGIKLEKAVEYL
ncbi:MAG: UDP-N-acetylmuramoyl-tripeptide--D-alanyl-D-alanine ligase [Bacteroidetes bacterium]|nr:MAG: UDP-N-acetylmuramoyl-tripeptide--D-alanyl-D-alanine ligase [Bacteroidota bacterium]